MKTPSRIDLIPNKTPNTYIIPILQNQQLLQLKMRTIIIIINIFLITHLI